MKNIFTSLLVAAVMLAACKSKGNGKEVEENRLYRLKNIYDSALMHKDKPMLMRLYADDYSYTNPEGKVLNKEQQVPNITGTEMSWQSNKSSDIKVKLYGPVAVMTGTYSAVGNYRGNQLTINERYTSVWMKKDTSWQMVAEQGSSIK